MGSIDLRERAIGLANEAVAADNTQQFELALAKYVQAIETFQIAIKYERAESVKETIRAKCIEYVERAEYLKKQVAHRSGDGQAKAVRAGGGNGRGALTDDEDDDADLEERPPLTKDELLKAEREMDTELAQLVGMEAVKAQMRKLCKQLALDIVRRSEGQTVLAPIRHCLMTGNPGTGKTSIARLVARLYKRLGVASKDHVVEVQKGDLVAGFVNQTATKTARKLKEARGGVLFVDEAYQLTQMLQRGQADFSGEAIDEMMKVMNEFGPRSITFIFAGYRAEMEQFLAYNPGLESRVKYRFHFDDYAVTELDTILHIKLKAAGWKLSADARAACAALIEEGTTAALRSRYNGRLVDNLFQWASDELNARIGVGVRGDELVTLTLADLQRAVGRFKQQRPADRIREAANGTEAGRALLLWGLGDFCEVAQERGYTSGLDLQQLDEQAMRGLKMLDRPADARRARALACTMRADVLAASATRDALYVPPDCHNVAAWLESVGCSGAAAQLSAHEIHFDVLGSLTYDDLREMGVSPVGLRRRLSAAIAQFGAQREAAKATALLGAVEVGTATQPLGAGALGGAGGGSTRSLEVRLSSIREVLSSVLPTAGRGKQL
ncbi:hypothetical protein KFE25_009736 [Diacronema lutheri]|uniref:SAM domain-containing protein n=2 Tax=Diacronema lutheri TaxID=2081491 RepID=A0A8J5Y0K9_DIALT|nr:hypothetical protein KFE25_009736 [Diacronema lutheri]